MNNKIMKNKIITAICGGVMFQWLSLFLSYRKLPVVVNENSLDLPIATGGFPLKIFSYPVPPMGNNWPPVNAWPMFLLNLAIWIAITTFLLFLFDKKLKSQNLTKKSIILALVFSLLGLFYLMIKFD